MCEPDPGLTSLLQTKVEQNGGYIRNSYRHSTYCAFISYTYVVGILRFTFTIAMNVYVRHLFCVPLDVFSNAKHFDQYATA
jgi:hypothetical protein